MKTIYVYELIRDGKRFYIGQSCNPEKRLVAHKSEKGRDISMRVLSEHDCRMEAKWRERELTDEMHGTEFINRGMLSESLYPRRHGDPVTAKRAFISDQVAFRWEMPDIKNMGWAHPGYPISWLSPRT